MVGNVNKLIGTKVESEGTADVVKKVLIGPKDGWKGYVMREFTLGVHGHTPKHIHPWPHINYVLKGNGVLYINGEANKIKAGSYAFVPPGAEHQFINLGEGTLEFICIVPEEGEK